MKLEGHPYVVTLHLKKSVITSLPLLEPAHTVTRIYLLIYLFMIYFDINFLLIYVYVF